MSSGRNRQRLAAFPAHECANYFTAAGSGPVCTESVLGEVPPLWLFDMIADTAQPLLGTACARPNADLRGRHTARRWLSLRITAWNSVPSCAF